ncbi:MAG: RNA methyltransferase [Deltaproteobacteria bacterium]|nr:RNA methyltransferase [Deltaproteobacteria bacterium]
MRKIGKDSNSSALANISVALVEPQSSGNVGSAARAMKNTGFEKLALIAPCDYKNNDAYSMACKATDVLLGAKVYSTLDECVNAFKIIVGTTRRIGRLRYPVMTLHEAVPKIIELASSNKTVILFGREDKGLKNEEIAVCDMLVEIPASKGYPSINLSHAVLLVCHCLFTAENPAEAAIKAVTREDMKKMYVHLESALRALGYGEKGGEYLLATILRSFRRLFGRTALMQKEVNMLRGIFTQIQERARPAPLFSKTFLKQ